MITEKEIYEAINECLQDPITGQKRAVLADLYVIHDHLFGNYEEETYSYSNKVENTIDIEGNTEFLKAVSGKSQNQVMQILNDFMEAIKALHPKMYSKLIQHLLSL